MMATVGLVCAGSAILASLLMRATREAREKRERDARVKSIFGDRR